MSVSFEEAARAISAALVGQVFVRFSRGDTWSFLLSNDLWLVSHEIRSPQERQIEAVAREMQSILGLAVDPEDVPLSAIVASQMRRRIVRVDLSPQAELILSFEGGCGLTLRSDVDIVDWQWALGAGPGDPYTTGSLVACFFAGEVEAGDLWRSDAG